MRKLDAINLMYHNIAFGQAQIGFREWQPAYDVSYESFLAHLDLMQKLDSGQVHLTFDDGYRSLHQLLVILKERFRIQCTCFITTTAIGQGGMLSRREIRELAEFGIRMGTHSHSHVFLENLAEQQLQAEVLAPKQILEDLIGQAVTAMSLPGGRYDRRAAEYAAANGYREMYASIPGFRRIRLVQQPPLELAPRWAITGRTSIDELGKILQAKPWHRFKHRSLYTLGRLGKRLLGNHGYHRMWQTIQHLITSTRSERVTS
jgi:hypothetical protein